MDTLRCPCGSYSQDHVTHRARMTADDLLPVVEEFSRDVSAARGAKAIKKVIEEYLENVDGILHSIRNGGF